MNQEDMQRKMDANRQALRPRTFHEEWCVIPNGHIGPCLRREDIDNHYKPPTARQSLGEAKAALGMSIRLMELFESGLSTREARERAYEVLRSLRRAQNSLDTCYACDAKE